MRFNKLCRSGLALLLALTMTLSFVSPTALAIGEQMEETTISSREIVQEEVLPSEPEAQPGDPEEQPADPEVQPADPEVQPADPEVQPADPEVQPADPEAEPENGDDLPPQDDMASTNEEPEQPLDEQETEAEAVEPGTPLEGAFPVQIIWQTPTTARNSLMRAAPQFPNVSGAHLNSYNMSGYFYNGINGWHSNYTHSFIAIHNETNGSAAVAVNPHDPAYTIFPAYCIEPLIMDATPHGVDILEVYGSLSVAQRTAIAALMEVSYDDYIKSWKNYWDLYAATAFPAVYNNGVFVKVQNLIWEIVFGSYNDIDPTSPTFWLDGSGNPKDYAAEMRAYFKNPSFTVKNAQLITSDQIYESNTGTWSLTDTTGVMATNYDIAALNAQYGAYARFELNGNTLNITKVADFPGGELTITIKQDGVSARDNTKYAGMVYGYMPGKQTRVMGCLVDPVQGVFKLRSANPLVQFAKTGINPDGSTPQLAGAVYGIYAAENIYNGSTLVYSKDQLVDTLTTSATERVNSIALLPGNYYALEQVAPKGYALDRNKHPFSVSSAPVQLTCSDYKQNVEVLKVDANNAATVLMGATFELYEQVNGSWVLRDTITTGQGGKATSSNVNTGSWKLVETEAPIGYTSGWEQEFTVTDADIKIELTATDYKQSLEVLKVDADNADTVLPSATFELYEQVGSSWELRDTITTDQNGKATSSKLNTGSWKLVETGSPKGYAAGWEQNFTVTDADTTVQLTATDKKQSLEVLKVDADNADTVLSGATFELYEQVNGSWVLRDTITTGQNGKATSSKLNSGSWKLVETVAPKGYTIGWEQEFAVTDADIKIELTATDTKQSLEVLKVDADNADTVLPGATFELYEQVGSSWELRDTITTGQNGKATSSKLNTGSWKLVETVSPIGYTSGWEQEFTVTDADTTVQLTATDSKQSLEVLKVDANNAATVLMGATFELYEQVDGSWALRDTITTDKTGTASTDKIHNGSWKLVETVAPIGYTSGWEQEFTVTADQTDYRFTATDKKQNLEVLKVDEDYIANHLPGAVFELYEDVDGEWVLRDTITTDETGTASSDKIHNGSWKLVETVAPIGYTSGWEQEFEVTAEQTDYRYTATDKKQNLEVLKVDADYIENHLPGAVFELYEQVDDSWVLRDTITTDKTGTASTDKISNGSWKLVETVAPIGYTSGWEQAFEVTADQTDYRYTATDKKQNLEVLKVDEDYIENHLPGAVFELYEQVDSSWVLRDTITTDETGTASTDKIHNGSWKLIETEAPKGYTSGWEQAFEVTADQTDYRFTATDKKQNLEVLKVDADYIENHLPGAVFELYEQVDSSWVLRDTITTDATGMASSDKIHNGSWKLVETVAPIGYTSGWEQEFEVSADQTDYRFTATDKKQNLELVKVNVYDYGIHLPGAVLELFEQVNGEWVLRDTLTTDKDGKASTDVLRNGKWLLVETKAPEGYHCEYRQEFEVTASNTTVQLTATNRPITYGYVKMRLTGKSYPKTGIDAAVLDDNGNLLVEYPFTAPVDAEPEYNAPETVEHNGSIYKLQDVSFVLDTAAETAVQHTETYTGLTEQEVPKTYTHQQDGQSVEMLLASVEYQQAAPLTAAVEYEWLPSAPAAPEMRTFTVDGKDITMTLKSVEQATDYLWQTMEIPAEFYGSAQDSGFWLEDILLPNTADAPAWQGYEAAILAYLGADAANMQLTGSRWVDAGFVTNADGVSYRGAVYTVRYLAAQWVAHYEAADATYTATAVYELAEPDETAYIATATYAAQVQAASGLPAAAIIAVSLLLLLILMLVAWILYRIRRKKQPEQQ